MKVKLVIQHKDHTIAKVYNDQDVMVGLLDEKRFMTHEECDVQARIFADQFPHLFPGRVEKKARFDVMVKGMKNGKRLSETDRDYLQ